MHIIEIESTYVVACPTPGEEASMTQAGEKPKRRTRPTEREPAE
jgi:hypothetical protein